MNSPNNSPVEIVRWLLMVHNELRMMLSVVELNIDHHNYNCLFHQLKAREKRTSSSERIFDIFEKNKVICSM